jgi:uncharacterized heparinase superfamily protein
LQRPLENMPWFRVQRRTEKKIQGNDFNWALLKTTCDIKSNESRILQLIKDLNSGHITILNECLPFHGGSSWSMVGGRKLSRLWRYTLHYHGWLVELAHGCKGDNQLECEKLIVKYLGDWIISCKIGSRGFNHYPWNSYTISTRLDYWRQLIAILPSKFWQDNLELKISFEESFKLQTQYLFDHLEWDLRGNHLLRDALGLINGASLIEGSIKTRVEKKSISMTLDQIEEQILGDGSHFELSPMYHIQFMIDLIKIFQLSADTELQKKIICTLQKMWEYINWLKHLDGKLVQFNDGSLMDLELVKQQIKMAGFPTSDNENKGVKFFKNSGVLVWQSNCIAFFMNAGKIGPDYQPGHAHADTLSLELSIYGRRLFVDPGTHSYCLDDKRKYDRGTNSHNTIEIDGENSSDVWHIFRVGRRAYPFNVKIFENEQTVMFEASHDGYRHLNGSPTHRRMINWYKDAKKLTILDEITGSGLHFLSGGWTLAPDWNCTKRNNGWYIEHAETNISLRMKHINGIEMSTRSVLIHPDYGTECKTQRLQWNLNTVLPVSLITYIDFN